MTYLDWQASARLCHVGLTTMHKWVSEGWLRPAENMESKHPMFEMDDVERCALEHWAPVGYPKGKPRKGKPCKI